MITWKEHGAALVGAVTLSDGASASVVLVAGRGNPKGAVLIEGQGGTPVPVSASLHRLTPEHVVDILCKQEQVFGKAAKPAS